MDIALEDLKIIILWIVVWLFRVGLYAIGAHLIFGDGSPLMGLAGGGLIVGGCVFEIVSNIFMMRLT